MTPKSFDSIFFALCLAQRRKRKRLLGGNPIFCPFVLSGLDDCYYCSNIIVYLLFKLCAKFSLRLQEREKVGACCPETDSVCLTEKFSINHQIWIFLTAWSIQLPFRHLFKVFLIWVAEVPRKNSPFSAVLFFSASAPVFLFAVFQSLSFLFLCKLFWAGKRNSSPSWKSLLSVE